MPHYFAATRELLPIWQVFGLNADLSFRQDNNAIASRRQVTVPKFLLVVGRVFRLIVYPALWWDGNAIGSGCRAFRLAAIVKFSGRVWASSIIPITGQRFDKLDAEFAPTEHFPI